MCIELILFLERRNVVRKAVIVEKKVAMMLWRLEQILSSLLSHLCGATVHVNVY